MRATSKARPCFFADMQSEAYLYSFNMKKVFNRPRFLSHFF